MLSYTLSGRGPACAFSLIFTSVPLPGTLCASWDSSLEKGQSQRELFGLSNTWGKIQLLSMLESDLKFQRQVKILQFKSE